MRFSRFSLFGRFLGASGLGTALGLAAGGLITVATGQALSPGSDWPTGLSGSVVLGAGIGAFTAWASRRWFLPATTDRSCTRRRVLLFAAAGMLVVPLDVAIGESHGVATLVLVLGAAGWVSVLTLWVRAYRRGFRRTTSATRAAVS